MTVWISMLRGINVSGQKQIRMAELQMVYESLGFTRVKTYVQSGNVLFESQEGDEAALGKQVESQIEQVFGYPVPVLLRSPQDFERIILHNHFLVNRNADPATLYVTFFHSLPTPQRINSLDKPNSGGDEFLFGEREVFLSCPGGYGKTKLSNNFFERKLGIFTTTRNWKTVSALAQLALSME